MFRKHGWNSREERLPRLEQLAEEGLVLSSEGVEKSVGWQVVRTVAFFKRPNSPSEVVSACVEFEEFGVTRRLFVDEEMELFGAFADALKRHLPFFRSEWNEKVRSVCGDNGYFVAFESSRGRLAV